jgi:hypothetical protein
MIGMPEARPAALPTWAYIAHIFAAKDASGKGSNRIAFGKVFGKP